LAAFFIVIVAVVATIFRLTTGDSKPDEFYFEFASNIANALSIIWLILVLIRNVNSDDGKLGRAIRAEMSTIVLMVLTTGVYSAIRIFKML
jgi:H+/gluconate symporter-like permease